jgi:O-acetyl-ADP-ribose deacetylase (regulator of RNase III)
MRRRILIEFVSGNIFDSDCQALVNPVNCVGISGKGLALAFKNKYPQMFQAYRQTCLDGKLTVGQLHIWPDKEKFIVNFPTKIHWRNPSQLQWIEMGLVALAEFVKENNIVSIALPKLGCGLGGLEFAEIKEKLINFSKQLENTKIIVYV